MVNESSVLEEAEQIRSAANKSKERFKDTADRIKMQAEDAWDDVTDLIRRHPGKAMGIMLVAGVSLGAAITAMAQSKNASPSDRLRDLAESGNDAWDRLRSGFSDAICSLKEAVDDAAKKFK